MSSKNTKRLAGALAMAVLAICLVLTFVRSNPRSTFEYLIAKPVPSSVDSIEEGSFRTLDSVFRVLRFKIEALDVRSILDSQGYKPVGKEELQRWDSQAGQMASITQEEYLQDWQGRVQALTKLRVHFTKDWQAYILVEGHGRKYLFCNTNSSETVFVADAH
jgi:hypothetical protein